MPEYRAVVGVDVPINQEEVQRIIDGNKAGRPILYSARKMQRYEAGETIGFLPDISKTWLLEQGLIEEVIDG